MARSFRNIDISYIIDPPMVWSYDLRLLKYTSHNYMEKVINLHIDIYENTLSKKNGIK